MPGHIGAGARLGGNGPEGLPKFKCRGAADGSNQAGRGRACTSRCFDERRQVVAIGPRGRYADHAGLANTDEYHASTCAREMAELHRYTKPAHTCP